jgi:putative DNA primase/helicase
MPSSAVSYSGTFQFEQLRALAHDRWRYSVKDGCSVADVACPSCGPGCSTAAHQRKRTLRIFRHAPDFYGFKCARCGVSGGVGDGRTTPLDRDTVERFRLQQERDVRAATENARWRKQRALAIWREAGDLRDTLSLRYLTRQRHLVIPEGVSGRVLRHHPACPWSSGDNKVPCLIALYRDIENDEPCAIQRTALTRSGEKIGRMDFAPKDGAAIKLSADIGDAMSIAEGTEKLIAGVMLGLTPGWALGGAEGICDFPVLPGVAELNIHVDNDSKGRDASAICTDRWQSAGRTVWHITSDVGNDLADLVALRAQVPS